MLAHVLSDIHLEMDNLPAKQDVANYFDKDNKADYLFLLGDIGKDYETSYKVFIESCTRNYKKVFLIAGNHEMYGSSVDETVGRLRDMCKHSDKLIFLNNDTYDIPDCDIRIVGTTLWSKVIVNQMSDVRCFIADFHSIKGWNVEHNNHTHENCVKWLEKEAQKAQTDSKKLIVMTHHAPLLHSCHPKHIGSPLSSAFETDLSQLIERNTHIKLFLHGHTHFSDKRIVGQTVVISNQYGYGADKDARDTFNPKLRINLNSL